MELRKEIALIGENEYLKNKIAQMDEEILDLNVMLFNMISSQNEIVYLNEDGDVEQFAEELEYYRKQKGLGK